MSEDIAVGDIVRYSGSLTDRHGLYKVFQITPGVGGYTGQTTYSLHPIDVISIDDPSNLHNVGRKSIELYEPSWGREIEVDAEPKREGWTFPEDLIESAWGLIANAGWDAGSGRVDLEKSQGWHQAALRWRDEYHAWLREFTEQKQLRDAFEARADEERDAETSI